MSEIKKHMGIEGSKPSVKLTKNVSLLYCKNCKENPTHTTTKEWFIPLKWYQLFRYGETCTWIICSNCFYPLKVK